MRDNAVLQGAARVWREPVLSFNDDTKDCFNQIFLHPSEIWKTSVLWLKLSDIASECQYTHVIEHVFGYGIGNASGFAQRFGNSLLELVARRMDVLDAPFLAAEAAPLREAMAARAALDFFSSYVALYITNLGRDLPLPLPTYLEWF